jgi:hypothetical protein
MFTVMTQFISAVLISATTLTNPTTLDNPTKPKAALSFETSAFVTVNNQIRVAVNKTADVPVSVILRDNKNNVLFERTVGKKELQYAVKLTVDELADGDYELEVKSCEGSIRKQLTLGTKPLKTSSRIVAMQ